jgi:hypothetical protein
MDPGRRTCHFLIYEQIGSYSCNKKWSLSINQEMRYITTILLIIMENLRYALCVWVYRYIHRRKRWKVFVKPLFNLV